MADRLIDLNSENNVAIVTMCNENKKNALSYDLLIQLKNTLQDLEANDEVKAIILQGKGNDFCAGMDINWFLKENPFSMRKAEKFIQSVFSYIEQYTKPLIASLSGMTLGAGLTLALHCDRRIASENAILGFPEIKIGVPVGHAAFKILQKYLGLGRIKDLLFTGRLVKAEEGMSLGLIDTIINQTDLMKETLLFAHELSTYSPLSIEMYKSALNASYEMSEQSVLAYTLDSLGFYWSTDDKKEGFEAFLNKRKPEFRGK